MFRFIQVSDLSKEKLLDSRNELPIIVAERAPTAAASIQHFLDLILLPETKSLCSMIMMKRVGIVIRDTDGRRINEHSCGDLLWLSNKPDHVYGIHSKNPNIVGMFVLPIQQ